MQQVSTSSTSSLTFYLLPTAQMPQGPLATRISIIPGITQNLVGRGSADALKSFLDIEFTDFRTLAKAQLQAQQVLLAIQSPSAMEIATPTKRGITQELPLAEQILKIERLIVSLKTELNATSYAWLKMTGQTGWGDFLPTIRINYVYFDRAFADFEQSHPRSVTSDTPEEFSTPSSAAQADSSSSLPAIPPTVEKASSCTRSETPQSPEEQICVTPSPEEAPQSPKQQAVASPPEAAAPPIVEEAVANLLPDAPQSPKQQAVASPSRAATSSPVEQVVAHLPAEAPPSPKQQAVASPSRAATPSPVEQVVAHLPAEAPPSPKQQVVASPSRTATPPPIEQVAPPEPSLSSHDVEKATPSKKSILKKLTPHKKPDAPPPPPKEGKTADSKQDPESGKKNLGGTTIHRRSVAAAKTSVE